MKRKLLASILITGLLSLSAGAGAFAYLSDTERATGNSLEAGTIDIVLSDGGRGADGQWSFSAQAPGQGPNNWDNGHLRIHNLGSLDSASVDIDYGVIGREDDDGKPWNGFHPGPDSDTNVSGIGSGPYTGMAASLRVDYLTYEKYVDGHLDSTRNLVWSSGSSWEASEITDVNGNGYVDLSDLESDGLDGLEEPKPLDRGAPNYDDFTELGMGVTLVDTGHPQNQFQGDVANVTVEVTLDQAP